MNDVLLQDLDVISDDRGQLTVIEIQKTFKILLSRVFFIQTDGLTTRGGHAHRLCNQIFICNSGSVNVLCSDSKEITNYYLQDSTFALFVPKGIWVELEFQSPALITVLCDQPYMEAEYIRDVESFNLEKSI
ncbi:putative dtdp-6-deoxy-3,4-keto-hexulose [Candidatus Planktophila lacus]|uniref:Dtdp-6-deoxy-3,4-keto-hexulose n=1 Tax=Candidatus Planktophila lacus TaxID=1884913 RepID=A0AAC9YS35_9ACTN|nr:putative dtdp-6-deoxy-3,4-keto-hexulose [Candidatus Planktophila lacus]